MFVTLQQSAGLFIRYLLDYPMSEEKFKQHLQQVVANISYEYQEGRLSGIALMSLVIEKLPQELLEKHAQLLFLPLVMQLLNDDSKDCRGKLSQCIVMLLNRSSTGLVKTFQEYCVRWSKQATSLRLASLQVFGLLAEARVDVLRTNSLVDEWADRLEENLLHRQQSNWEVTYFSLNCVEKLSHNFKETLSKRIELWSSIVDCLVDDHPWVMISSSRILKDLFSSGLVTGVLATKHGLLFNIVRNLCFQLNTPEENQNEDLTDMATMTLTQALPLMKNHPEFCYNNDIENDEEPDWEAGRDPIFWLMRRLSQVAKNKGTKRRLAVYKCYAAFASGNFSIVAPHFELMLESLYRTIIEGKNEFDNHALSQKRKSSSVFVQQLQQQQQRDVKAEDGASSEFSMAEEVLRLLEESCETPDEFLNAYSSVKRRARDKKQKRKTEEKSMAVLDPKAFAEQKIQKQVRNKERRKRRAHEQRRERGGLDKRRRSS
jgi:U3 small nucleolar RNA-associated protein 20